MKSNFYYKDSSGLIDINTLSPSSAFYYQVQAPVALNPAAFGCKIAFFNDRNEMLYHRREYYAHELHSLSEIGGIREQTLQVGSDSFPKVTYKSIEIVNWSKQGNTAYMLEYYRWNDTLVYESVILYLAKKYCYRINENDNDFKIVNELKIVNYPFDEHIVENKLKALGVKDESLYLDLVKQGFFSKKWFPLNIKAAH
jgi:hypothetical protein